MTAAIEHRDPLFPARVLLPLHHSGGVQLTIPTVPGRLRPFAATLGVTRPVEGKKHDTTASKWDEVTPSKTSRDGVVDDDSHTDTHTDS